MTDGIYSHELVKDCLAEVTGKYMEYIKESVPVAQLVVNGDAAIKTVYSAMHGVGYKYVVEAFQTVNLKVSNWQSSVFSLLVSGLEYFSVSSVDVA